MSDQRRHKKSRRVKNKDDDNNNNNSFDDFDDETTDANLNQLIVKNNEPVFETPFMNMDNNAVIRSNDIGNGKILPTNRNYNNNIIITGKNNNDSDSSVFRNCAVAIAKQNRENPTEPLLKPLKKETFITPTDKESQHIIENDIITTKQSQQQAQQQAQQQSQKQQPQQVLETYNMKYDGITDYNNMTQTQYGYMINDDIEMLEPLVYNNRRFNKKAFRIVYIIVIIVILLSLGCYWLINKINKHKKEIEEKKRENITNKEETKEEQLINDNEEYNNINEEEDENDYFKPVVKSMNEEREEEKKTINNMLIGGDYEKQSYKPLRDSNGRFIKRKTEDEIL